MRTLKKISLVQLLCIVAAVAGCQRPDLEVHDLQVQRIDLPDRTIQYECVIENRDYGGNIFVRPTKALGPIVISSYLSSDGIAEDGGFSGGLIVVRQGDSIPVDGQKNVSMSANAHFDDNYPYFLVKVRSRSGQTEYCDTNNSSSERY